VFPRRRRGRVLPYVTDGRKHLVPPYAIENADLFSVVAGRRARPGMSRGLDRRTFFAALVLSRARRVTERPHAFSLARVPPPRRRPRCAVSPSRANARPRAISFLF
jgi:hypothetical protein